MEDCMINPPDDYDDGRAYEEEDEDSYEAERLEFEADEAHTRLWAGEDVYDVQPMPIINVVQTRKKIA